MDYLRKRDQKEEETTIHGGVRQKTVYTHPVATALLALLIALLVAARPIGTHDFGLGNHLILFLNHRNILDISPTRDKVEFPVAYEYLLGSKATTFSSGIGL